MKWDQVTIKTEAGKVFRGAQARKFVNDNFPGLVTDTTERGYKLQPGTVALCDNGKYEFGAQGVQSLLTAKCNGKGLRCQVSVSDPSLRPEGQGPLAAKGGGHARKKKNNRIRVIAATLQMHLDCDRDGAIDADPTHHDDWTWGRDGHGAVIAVKLLKYADPALVEERVPIEFRWEAGPRLTPWQATLEADHPERIRIYRHQNQAAALLLDAAHPSCTLHTLGAEDQPGLWRLWMEAVAFPQTTAEADWLVTLTFKLTSNGAEKKRQTAVVRIAPWIMANDLDPTQKVFARRGTLVPEGAPVDRRLQESNAYAVRYNGTAAVIENFVGAGFVACDTASNKSRKGFARDVIKSGYNTTPRYSGGVIIKCPDPDSPLDASLPSIAEAASDSGLVTDLLAAVPQAQYTGQDNGGNFMVSPPTPAYPWGRILYGHDATHPCHFRPFFDAQKLQAPLALDSTWLSVGHVDEMLSFVRGADGQYRALLMSPRLAYILVAGAAKRPAADTPANVIAWAAGINADCVQAGAYSEAGMLAGIGADLNAAAAPPLATVHGVDAYEENPAAPALERAVVFRTADTNLAEVFGVIRRDLNAAFPSRVGRLCYELRAHASHFLATVGPVMLQFTAEVQPRIDATRTVLETTLGIPRANIIDVPVLLNCVEGNYVALTGDSVNFLALAGNPATRCLIPKPFGAVFRGEYLFERYLHDKLAAIGVADRFAVDDGFHVVEGEIHCGTNQTHAVLQGDRQAWWQWHG